MKGAKSVVDFWRSKHLVYIFGRLHGCGLDQMHRYLELRLFFFPLFKIIYLLFLVVRFFWCIFFHFSSPSTVGDSVIRILFHFRSRCLMTHREAKSAVSVLSSDMWKYDELISLPVADFFSRNIHILISTSIFKYFLALFKWGGFWRARRKYLKWKKVERTTRQHNPEI